MTWIDDDAAQAIRRVPNFGYPGWDINLTVDTYVRQFVEPAAGFMRGRSFGAVADVGTGFGWLSIAFAFCTEVRIIAVEPDKRRLEAARKIAEIAGVGSRIEWREGSISRLPINDREVDVCFCIEVLEHSGVASQNVRELARVTNDLLMLTTPNKLFPIINHDTRLPFCHWLPVSLRNRYADLFGKGPEQHGNMFWSPARLLSDLDDFEMISSFQQFSTYDDYLRCRPILPSKQGKMARIAFKSRDLYFKLAALAGRRSLYLLPNMASTFRRRQGFAEIRREVETSLVD